ncbi:paladin-like [Mobula hypostoma]|uniref:paladin-like n=1 Tax=Mobula hypostoma TaxID=723540 RepID=UPI002FC283EC
MGQTTLNGFQIVLQKLKEEGNQSETFCKNHILGTDGIQLLDFAVLSNKVYFAYHGTEQFVAESLPKTIENVEDVRISEEVYRGYVFTMPYFSAGGGYILTRGTEARSHCVFHGPANTGRFSEQSGGHPC